MDGYPEQIEYINLYENFVNKNPIMLNNKLQFKLKIDAI